MFLIVVDSTDSSFLSFSDSSAGLSLSSLLVPCSLPGEMGIYIITNKYQDCRNHFSSTKYCLGCIILVIFCIAHMASRYTLNREIYYYITFWSKWTYFIVLLILLSYFIINHCVFFLSCELKITKALCPSQRKFWGLRSAVWKEVGISKSPATWLSETAHAEFHQAIGQGPGMGTTYSHSEWGIPRWTGCCLCWTGGTWSCPCWWGIAVPACRGTPRSAGTSWPAHLWPPACRSWLRFGICGQMCPVRREMQGSANLQASCVFIHWVKTQVQQEK